MDIESTFRRNRVEVAYLHTTKDNISIHCPWCGASDKSFHLHVNVKNGACHCFRNSSHNCHVRKVFIRLGIATDNLEFVNKEAVPEKEKDYSAWKYFTPAEENEECIRYMESRGFPQARRVLQNCRVSPNGRWCGRVIFPLTVGWTGRSMRPHIEPRYLTNSTKDGFFLVDRSESDSVIIVEGVMDALKIAEASCQFSVIARCGIEVRDPIIKFLHTRYMVVYLIPDRTVDVGQVDKEFSYVRSCLPRTKIKQITLPVGIKDLGECTISQTRSLLICMK